MNDLISIIVCANSWQNTARDKIQFG